MREVTKARTMGMDSQKKTIEDQGRGPLYRIYCTREDKAVLCDIVLSFCERFTPKGVGL